MGASTAAITPFGNAETTQRRAGIHHNEREATMTKTDTEIAREFARALFGTRHDERQPPADESATDDLRDYIRELFNRKDHR
ncbi:MAG: hypothetical protein ACR2FE_00465 [Aeromicrobium sp.]